MTIHSEVAFGIVKFFDWKKNNNNIFLKLLILNVGWGTNKGVGQSIPIWEQVRPSV